mmetsp:Transcript_41720/g.95744  ORF Transcript_41720/g.95744 Transcript_41720/m.95744 type:complete len:92 (-) Transcript_41720:3522-3797(-)
MPAKDSAVAHSALVIVAQRCVRAWTSLCHSGGASMEKGLGMVAPPPSNLEGVSEPQVKTTHAFESSPIAPAASEVLDVEGACTWRATWTEA